MWADIIFNQEFYTNLSSQIKYGGRIKDGFHDIFLRCHMFLWKVWNYTVRYIDN